MPACVYCGQGTDLRLFDVRHEGRVERVWSCLECAWIKHRLGLDIAISPEWIQRAALRRLPVRELLTDPPGPERRTGTPDRRVKTAGSAG